LSKFKRLLKLLFLSAGFSILFGILVAWLWAFSEIAVFGYIRLAEPNVIIWTVEVIGFCFGVCFVLWLFKKITCEYVDYDPKF